MVTTNIREYSDEDIIALINGCQSGDIPYTLNELKKLLSEVTNRRIDSKYTGTLTNLMQGEITRERNAPSESSSIKRPVANASKDTSNRENSNEVEFDDDYERFPVLSFLAGLFKVLAWFFFVIIISGSAILSFIYFKDQAMYIAAGLFGGVMVGTIILLFFYAKSEKIQLRLEIEHHLRRL